MEEEDFILRSFSLCQRHYDLLDNVNKTNKSQALRTVLDSIINGEEQAQRKVLLDNSIMFIAFGFFFYILLSLFEIGVPWITSFSIGTMLLLYGSLGGIKLVLRRTRR